MTSDDDFSPIRERGTIERARGILGRWGRRSSLPPVGHGYQRVLIDDDGRVTGGRNLSAGEKYWAQGSTWVTIDMGSRRLAYDLPVDDRSGRAGYVVTIAASAQVNEGYEHEVVRDRATAVKPLLTSALREMLAVAMSNIATDGHRPSGRADPSADLGLETAGELHRLRREVEDALRRQLVGQPVDPLPEWLRTSVVSIGVRLDDSSEAHVRALVDQARSGVLEERNVSQRIARRAMWRNELAPRLPGADVRMLEAVLDNPTSDAVARTIEHMQGTEAIRRNEMLDVLKLLVDSNHIDDVRDADLWRAVQAIGSALDPRNNPTAILEAGDSSLASNDVGVIDTSAETAEHEGLADVKSDRDWTGG